MAEKFNVTGMTVQDILNLDNRAFNKLGESDMRKVVNRLTSAANKRLRTFEKTGEISPAAGKVFSSGGRFSTKGKDLNELRAEYGRVRSFMGAKTGTIRGWRSVKRQTVDTLKKKGIDVDPDKLEDVLRVYDRLKEVDPTIEERSLKYKVISEIDDTIEDIQENTEPQDDEEMIDEVVKAMRETITRIYEEERENDQGNGVSEFFEM